MSIVSFKRFLFFQLSSRSPGRPVTLSPPPHPPPSLLPVCIHVILLRINTVKRCGQGVPRAKKRQTCILATTYKLIYVLIIYAYINIYVNKPQIDFPDAREGRKNDKK